MRSEEEEAGCREFRAGVTFTAAEMDTARDFEGLVDAKLYQVKQWAMREYHRWAALRPRCWPDVWD